MKSRQAGKFYSLLMFMVVSCLAGLLVAGLAIPVAAMAGVAGTAVSSSLSELPMYLATPPQAQKTRLQMSDGSLLAEFYDENRLIVSLDEISPYMQKAQLAIEDHRFYEHGALDLKGFLQAVITNLPGGSEGRGGSTLTQQYVKQVRVEEAQSRNDVAGVAEAQDPSLKRKILEMRYAIELENRFTKDEILNNYLNIAYYGDGAYGVEAAAHHYFNTTAAKLTLGQAAMLAGIVQYPSRNPNADVESATNRRDTVLAQMVKYEYITQAEADEAMKEVYDPDQGTDALSGCANSRYPFVCQYAELALLDMPYFGADTGNAERTAQQRKTTLYRGGYTITIVINPAVQDAAQDAVSSLVAPTDRVVGVMAMVQPGTGKIIAMAQNRPWGTDTSTGAIQYNDAVDSDMGGREGYQLGSTFKAFTIAAALDSGIPPTKVFNSPGRLDMSKTQWKGCDGSFTTPYQAQNANAAGFGKQDMYKAAINSVNTYFLQLEQMVGVCKTVQMASSLGVKEACPECDDYVNTPEFQAAYPGTKEDYTGDLVADFNTRPSFTLGSLLSSPLNQATAFATFAARGIHCDPIILGAITDNAGKSIEVPSANCAQAIRPEVADGVNRILSGVAQSFGGSYATLPGYRPFACKTGTDNETSSLTFAGYTPEIAGVALLAVDRDRVYADYWGQYPQGRPRLIGYTLENGTYLPGYSHVDPPRMWRPAMSAAIEILGLPATGFTAPPASILVGAKTAPPDTKGMSPEQARKVLEDAGYLVDKKEVYDDSPKGTYLGATCEPYAYSTCDLTYSQGPRPKPPSSKPTTSPGDDDDDEEGGG
ncbi:MAG: transglycosylase domain-containing protein [Propionibacteriaceae bacterium]|jgi:membrane peptidoglycan carboxypeptidase|nr:transglycosylase domain-containing protein [Propionibacteriaceae bacterium]